MYTYQKTNYSKNLALYELGELSNEKSLYLFSDLIKTRHINVLGDHYLNVAKNLINKGILDESGDVDEFTAINYGFNL
jgi:hypothetical protein